MDQWTMAYKERGRHGHCNRFCIPWPYQLSPTLGLWDRFERADRFEPYLDRRTQGVTQRQAAKELQVPRTTFRVWHSWHHTLDICPEVTQIFSKQLGLAFLHRLILALHLVCAEVSAWRIRLVCLL